MAVAFVRDVGQGQDGDPNFNVGARSVVLDVPAAGCAAGNTVVVWVTHRAAGGALSVSDSAGNVYTLRRQEQRSDLVVSLFTGYLGTGLTDSDAVTVAHGSTSALAAGAAEFSGVSAVDPVDGSAAAQGSGSNPSATLPATSGAGRMLVAANGHGAAGNRPASVSAGWTGLNSAGWQFSNGAEYVVFRAYRAAAAAGTYSVTYSYGTQPGTWCLVVVALQSAPAPGASSAPTGLTATGGSGRIDLAWTDTSADETGFKVERSADGGSSWAQIAVVGANVTAYADTGLPAGTTFHYRVRATNGNGDSAYSNTASATTASGSTATPPAAPGGLVAVGIGQTRIRLTWEDCSTDEERFRVERSADGQSGWMTVGVVPAEVVQWVNGGLQPGTTWWYRVRAENGAGASAYTAAASGTTLPADQRGSGDCPSEPYATVADVQGRVWTELLTITDSSEPSRALVEDWLCQMSQWVDATLAWRYRVPVTDAVDRERLRPAVAALVAAQCWEVLAPRNPDSEERSGKLRAEGYGLLVYHPGGVGTWMPGGSSVVLGRETGGMGRSLLVLPNTAEAAGTPASRGETPVGTFRRPGEAGEPERRFWGRRRL